MQTYKCMGKFILENLRNNFAGSLSKHFLLKINSNGVFNKQGFFPGKKINYKRHKFYTLHKIII